VSLAQDLTKQGHEATATEGRKSQFDVLADGALIFSKEEAGRFPELEEISRRL
jgi:predicted Rdx family selenoprotein